MEEAKSYYNEKSKNYDETLNMLGYRVLDAVTWKYLEPYVPTDPEATALDAGGGTGRWAVRMARKGCRVVLLDASNGMLDVAAKRIEQEQLQQRITLRKGNMAETGFEDECFDVILCEHSLFLFREPNIALKEFARILKKKAPLIVSVHNRYVQVLCRLERPTSEDMERALRVLRCEEYGSLMGNGKVKVYTWTPDEFRTMLEGSGFRVEKIVGKGTTMPLRISNDVFMLKDYPEELFNRILEFELAVCEKPDALALAGHLQAIAYKK